MATTILSPNAKQQFFTDGSTVAAGYLLYTYAANTTTPQATFKDRAGLVANDNPIVLDARGEAVVYLTPGVVYDYVLKTDQDVTVWTREDVIADAGDANAVSFTQAGTGMVKRDAESKMRDIVHADDRGLIGNASDETAALQDLFNAAVGKVLMLGNNKTYGIAGATGLTIPANTTLIANGSRFRKLSVSATPAIVTGANFTADNVVLDIQGGDSLTDAGIRFGGSHTHVAYVEVNALNFVSASTAGDPVWIGSGTNGVICTDMQIDYVKVTKCRNPITMQDLRDSTLGYAELSDTRRGVYIRDCKRTYIKGGANLSMDPTAAGTPGQNAILIESVAANYSTQDIYIYNFISYISGEHGFRIGGQKIAKNIHHTNCAAYNTGSGSAPLGGGGFKCLGADTVPAKHEDIFYTGCFVEDGGQDNSNWSGFIMGLIQGLTISNCRVRKNTRTFSAMDGYWVDSCTDVNISNCSVVSARRYGIRISANTAGHPTENVNISGCETHVATGGFGVGVNVHFDADFANVRNVNITGLLARNGRHCVDATTPGGGFSYSNVRIDAMYRDPNDTSAGPPFQGTTAFRLRVDSPWYGTFSSGANNGSIFQDDLGNVRILKAGAWTTL